jgi:Fic family protein
MSLIVIFILGMVVGGLIVWMIVKREPRLGSAQDDRQGAKENLIEKQARVKQANKQQILGLLETQSPLTNNHVEQLLDISDATATRYLEELEKEDKVRQVGKTGQAVYYEKI